MGEFEWDPAKAAANLRKRNVAFDLAGSAFRDPFAVEWIDDRFDYGEERVVRMGAVEDRLLVVAYTVRGDRIWIIRPCGDGGRSEVLPCPMTPPATAGPPSTP